MGIRAGATPGMSYTVFARDDADEIALGDLQVKPDGTGAATVTTRFFGQFDRVELHPKMS